MINNKRLLILYFSLLCVALAFAFKLHNNICLEAQEHVQLRTLLQSLKAADKHEQKQFFSANFHKNINRRYNRNLWVIQHIDSFHKDSLVYPANMVLSIIEYLQSKPAKQFAFTHITTSGVRLQTIEMASTRFEVNFYFLRKNNQLQLNDIDGLAEYFDYVDCVANAQSKKTNSKINL